jgi:ABC-type Mn2+/Zn2+ transport system ATPase subunit
VNPLLELTGVRFGYNGKLVLDGIDFHLHHGQFVALVGPSGAGKTTLLKLMLGLLQPTGGRIAHRAKPPLRMAYVPQLETVDWNFPVTAEEVVLMGITQRGGWWPWPSAADRRRARELLAQLGIGDLAGRHIRDLSGGQQQRVFLARALIAEPELLVLDEPTNGVDMRSAENIFHQLAHLSQSGITVVLTTHDLNMAAAHAPWVVCLNRSIIAQGPPEAVFTEAVLSETYQGEMLVVRHEGLILIQQKPHPHTYHDLLPTPVPGGLPGHVQNGECSVQRAER